MMIVQIPRPNLSRVCVDKKNENSTVGVDVEVSV